MKTIAPNALRSRIIQTVGTAQRCPFCCKMASPIFHHELSAGKDPEEWIDAGAACYRCLGVKTYFFMAFRNVEVKTDSPEIVTSRKRKLFKI